MYTITILVNVSRSRYISKSTAKAQLDIIICCLISMRERTEQHYPAEGGVAINLVLPPDE